MSCFVKVEYDEVAEILETIEKFTSARWMEGEPPTGFCPPLDTAYLSWDAEGVMEGLGFEDEGTESVLISHGYQEIDTVQNFIKCIVKTHGRQ
jgi:hypothetical protein